MISDSQKQAGLAKSNATSSIPLREEEIKINSRLFDAVVVGAGPAGSSAAALLGAQKLTVAFIDDATHTQWKIGESLPGAAIRLLRRLGISQINELLAPEHYKNCVANASAWGSNSWQYKDAIQNPEGGGWHLMRHEFDKALQQRALEAGAIHLEARVYNIVQLADQAFEITLKPDQAPIKARYLIDATGRSAAIARRLGAERERIDTQMAAYTWLKPHTGDADNTTRVKSVENGWWYTTRLPNNYRILAYHGTAEQVAAMTKEPTIFLNACNSTDLIPLQIILTPEHLHTPIKTHDAGVSRLTTPYGKGWLAIGDAALSFDPLSSQGIFFALYSAIRGAEAFLSGTDEAFQQYAGLVNSVFEANMRGRREFYEGLKLNY